MRHGHLSDDRLIEACFLDVRSDAMSPAEQQHLSACVRCDARRIRLLRMMDEVTEVAAAAADAVFPPERLARQQSRILAHLQHEGRPARVIAFPAAHTPHESVASRTRPGSRWIAAAAVAGLFVGVIAGRFGHDYSFISFPSANASRVIVARTAEDPELRAGGTTTIREVTASISDEDLLDQLEIAIDAPAAAALQPIDDLTPLAWEVR